MWHHSCECAGSLFPGESPTSYCMGARVCPLTRTECLLRDMWRHQRTHRWCILVLPMRFETVGAGESPGEVAGVVVSGCTSAKDIEATYWKTQPPWIWRLRGGGGCVKKRWEAGELEWCAMHEMVVGRRGFALDVRGLRRAVCMCRGHRRHKQPSIPRDAFSSATHLCTRQ